MTSPPPVPGWYPDTSGENLRYWDGTAWTPAVRPTPVPRALGLPVRWWAVIVVVVLTGLVAGGVIRWWLQHSTEQQRWSLWPHTMGCTVVPRPDFPAPAPPASVHAKQVTVERMDGAKVAVSVAFAAPPPGPARQVRSPYGGTMDAPGSLHLMFYITAPHLGSPSAYQTKGIVIDTDGPGEWSAWQDNLTPGGKNDGQLPVSVSGSGQVIRIELDLTGQDLLFGKGSFTPTVSVDAFVITPPTRDAIDGDLRFFQAQLCTWENPTTLNGPAEGTRVQTVPPAPAPNREPSTMPRAPQPKSPSGFPADGRLCPPRYGPTGAFTESASGNGHTSCEFAEEVRIAYADMGQPGSFQRLIVASPVTNTFIEMTCGPAAAGFIVCRGGADAVVYLN